MLLCLDTFKMFANPHFSVVHSEDDRPDRDTAGQPAVPAKTVSQTNRKFQLFKQLLKHPFSKITHSGE